MLNVSASARRRATLIILPLMLAALILMSLPAHALAQSAAGGEANLVLPDLAQATFLGGTSGRTLLMWGLVVCALGLLFGYILVLPVAIEFLINWNPIGIEVMWQFSEYIGTVSTLLLYMGLAFETPLLMFFLTKLRVLDPVRAARYRKYVLVVSFIIGAMITPTPDPMNQTLVSLPIYLLFELGLLLSRLA